MIGYKAQKQDLIDIHCHIVPYVDDGAEDIDIAKEMLEEEYLQGVRTTVMTVHFRYGMFDTQIDKVKRYFTELKEYLASSEMSDMDILLTREYYCDERLNSLLDGYISGRDKVFYEDKEYSPEEEIIPFGKQKCILLEFSSGRVQDGEFDLYINKTLEAGLTPIIAHVERYPAVQSNASIVRRMQECGAYIQVNCGSLLSWKNSLEKKTAKALMKYGMVDMLASDAHDLEKRSPNIGINYNYLSKNFGKNTIDRLLCGNAQSLIYDIQ